MIPPYVHGDLLCDGICAVPVVRWYHIWSCHGRHDCSQFGGLAFRGLPLRERGTSARLARSRIQCKFGIQVDLCKLGANCRTLSGWDVFAFSLSATLSLSGTAAAVFANETRGLGHSDQCGGDHVRGIMRLVNSLWTWIVTAKVPISFLLLRQSEAVQLPLQLPLQGSPPRCLRQALYLFYQVFAQNGPYQRTPDDRPEEQQDALESGSYMRPHLSEFSP